MICSASIPRAASLVCSAALVFGQMNEPPGARMRAVLTADAEWPGEIDTVHAQFNREQAEQRLREKPDDMEIQNDQVLLRRGIGAD